MQQIFLAELLRLISAIESKCCHQIAMYKAPPKKNMHHNEKVKKKIVHFLRLDVCFAVKKPKQHILSLVLYMPSLFRRWWLILNRSHSVNHYYSVSMHHILYMFTTVQHTTIGIMLWQGLTEEWKLIFTSTNVVDFVDFFLNSEDQEVLQHFLLLLLTPHPKKFQVIIL